MKHLLLLPLLCFAICAGAQTFTDSVKSKNIGYQVVVINGVEHKDDGVNAFIEPPDPNWLFGITDLRKMQADLKQLNSYDKVYRYMTARRWQFIDKNTDEITSLTEFEAKFRKPNPYFKDPLDKSKPEEETLKKEKQAAEKKAKNKKEQKSKPDKEPKREKEQKPKRKARVNDW